METINIGNTNISPPQILNTGLRKELVRNVSALLHHSLQYPFKGDMSPNGIMDFMLASTKSFTFLSCKLNSLRQALEHVQDYIEMSGIKMWKEEFSRIMQFNVE